MKVAHKNGKYAYKLAHFLVKDLIFRVKIPAGENSRRAKEWYIRGSQSPRVNVLLKSKIKTERCSKKQTIANRFQNPFRERRNT